MVMLRFGELNGIPGEECARELAVGLLLLIMKVPGIEPELPAAIQR